MKKKFEVKASDIEVRSDNLQVYFIVSIFIILAVSIGVAALLTMLIEWLTKTRLIVVMFVVGAPHVRTPPLATVTFCALRHVVQLVRMRVPDIVTSASATVELVAVAVNPDGTTTESPLTGTPLNPFWSDQLALSSHTPFAAPFHEYV